MRSRRRGEAGMSYVDCDQGGEHNEREKNGEKAHSE